MLRASMIAAALALPLAVVAASEEKPAGRSEKPERPERPERPKTPSITAIAPVFGQLVAFTQPAGFKVANEKSDASRYIREAVPSNQSLQRWTELITVTGAKGGAANPKQTPKALVEVISGGFKQSCPSSFVGKSLGSMRIADHEAFGAIASCGSVRSPQAEHSETALLVAIKGSSDLYSIQWAERGAASAKPLPIAEEKWRQRLEQLGPIRLCPIVAGEAPPYPSCVGRPR